MKNIPCLLGLVAASAAASFAQTTTDTSDRPSHGRRGHFGHPGPGLAVVRALDADKNRELSADEITNAANALRALDANNDGAVTRDELRPVRPAGAPERPERPTPPEGAPRVRPVDPVMLALDADGDGSLSVAEIASAPASLAALDADKDGKLVADEFRPLPPEGAPEGAKRRQRGPRN